MRLATCRLDDADDVALVLCTLVECLKHHGFTIEVLAGTILVPGPEDDPAVRPAAHGWTFEAICLEPVDRTPPTSWPYIPSLLRMEVGAVPVGLFRGPDTRPYEHDDD